jgi:predicted transcriptional regulator
MLSLLGHAQMQQMASCSGVPFTTLWKLRSGETADPRLETVRLLLPHLMADKAA